MPASWNRNRRTATRAGPFSGAHTAVRNVRMLHKERQDTPDWGRMLWWGP